MAPVSYLQTKISNIQSGAAPKWSGDDGKDVVAGLKTGLFSKLVPWHSTLDWRICEIGWVELTNSGSLPVLFLSFIWNWRLVLSSHRIQLKVEPAVILTSPFSEYRMTLSRPAIILKNCFLDFVSKPRPTETPNGHCQLQNCVFSPPIRQCYVFISGIESSNQSCIGKFIYLLSFKCDSEAL